MPKQTALAAPQQQPEQLLPDLSQLPPDLQGLLGQLSPQTLMAAQALMGNAAALGRMTEGQGEGEGGHAAEAPETAGAPAASSPPPSDGIEDPDAFLWDLVDLAAAQQPELSEQIADVLACVPAPRPEAPESKDEALILHQIGVNKVNRMLEGARALGEAKPEELSQRELLLRNAVEWVDQGYTELKILSRVHDSHRRPSVAPNCEGLFDDRVMQGAGADYDETLGEDRYAHNDAGVYIGGSGAAGTMSVGGGTLTFVQASENDQAFLEEVLIHEVQHDADQHDPGAVWQEEGGEVGRLQAGAHHRGQYSSEFRAYWVDTFESPTTGSGMAGEGQKVRTVSALVQQWDDSTQELVADTWTVTVPDFSYGQAYIFEHLLECAGPGPAYLWDGQWVGGNYSYLPYYYVVDPSFYTFVNKMQAPSGGNLVNSVRIQRLSEAAETGSWSTFAEALQALDAGDISALSDSYSSKQLYGQVERKMPEFAQDVFTAVVMYNARKRAPRQTQVRAGESMVDVAIRAMDDTQGAPRLAAANLDTLKAVDPEHPKVGSWLHLPAR